MASIYPSRWPDRMGAAPQYPVEVRPGEPHPRAGELTVKGDTWARGLSGLTAEQIAHGLAACIQSASTYVPDLGEFRALCLGIPSYDYVVLDVKRSPGQRSPFTIMVWSRIDGWSYRHADATVADRLLRRAYDDAKSAVMRGEPLPERPVGVLEDDSKNAPKVKPDPKVAASAIAEIRAMFQKKQENENNDV